MGLRQPVLTGRRDDFDTSRFGCGCDEFRWRGLVMRRLVKGGIGLAALGLGLPRQRFWVLRGTVRRP